MSVEHVDYHVGILRGFILAHNAHQSVLHALNVVLTDYRSKAGQLIGANPPAPQPRRTELLIPDLKPLKRPEPQEDKVNDRYWTAAEDAEFDRMYIDGGVPIADIEARFKISANPNIVGACGTKPLCDPVAAFAASLFCNPVSFGLPQNRGYQ